LCFDLNNSRTSPTLITHRKAVVAVLMAMPLSTAISRMDASVLPLQSTVSSWTEKGVPLVIHTAPANASDHGQILPTVAEFTRDPGKPRRPRSHPDVRFADREHASEATRDALRAQAIEPDMARRGEDYGSCLARVRWVVERTITWFKEFRRIRVR